MKKIFLAAAVSLAGSLYSQAQSVVTDPVGFVSVTVPGQSDAALGAPLGRANEYQGVVQSVSGSVITVAGTTGWLANQFVYAAGTQPKRYYARIDSGAREGLIAEITANDASTLTVTVPAKDDIAAVVVGDSLSIAPYWTLGTLLTGVPANTKVFLYSPTDEGVDLAGTVYTFVQNLWKIGTVDKSDTILPPYQGFTLRNVSLSPIVVSITGSVPMAKNRLVVRTLQNNTSQDQRIFFNSPVPELLADTGLGITPFDSVYIIDNSVVGQNKAGTKVTWTGSKWKIGSQDVTATQTLQPGTSFILRKIQTTLPSAAVSTHLQSYLQ